MVKKRPFHSIRDILGKLANSGKWDAKIRQYAFFREWEKIVGLRIAKQAQPKIWQGSTLVVEVSHPTWLQELKMMERNVLDNIRAESPEIKIEKIKWVLR